MRKVTSKVTLRWVAPATAVLIAAVLYAVYWLRSDPTPDIITSPVIRGDIEKTVEATGVLKPSRLISVGAQVSGRIEKLQVTLGEKVKAGDLIAEIDSRVQLNSLKSAEAALRNAQASREVQIANLHQYDLVLQRQRKMLEMEATSQADFDSARANVESARAQVKALEATISQQQTEVANAQTNLAYTKVTAPIDGTVLKIVSKQGQTVNAALSAPTIVIIGDLSRMAIYAEISEADVVKTKVGQEVGFTVLGMPEKRYASTLKGIAPAPDSITNEEGSSSNSTSSGSSSAIYYNGLFEVENLDGKLRAYMTAQVSIVLNRVVGTLLIPSSAVGHQSDSGRYFVEVVDKDGRRQRRQVVLGLDNNTLIEVKAGLEEGEQVVVGEDISKDSSLQQGLAAPSIPPPM